MVRETIPIAARLAGVPERTIRNWVRDGRITERWDRGRRLVEPQEVMALRDMREDSGQRQLPNLPGSGG